LLCYVHEANGQPKIKFLKHFNIFFLTVAPGLA
jgi:hypothetical protein